MCFVLNANTRPKELSSTSQDLRAPSGIFGALECPWGRMVAQSFALFVQIVEAGFLPSLLLSFLVRAIWGQRLTMRRGTSTWPSALLLFLHLSFAQHHFYSENLLTFNLGVAASMFVRCAWWKVAKKFARFCFRKFICFWRRWLYHNVSRIESGLAPLWSSFLQECETMNVDEMYLWSGWC